MLISEKYQIQQMRLVGVPQIPYKDGVGGFRGVCAHSTANYGVGDQEDTAVSERNWEQSHWDNAFVHYFCDYQTILDVADDNYISYGCSGGNPYYVNFEICQTKRADRFAESYDRWVWLMAKILYKHKLGVIDGQTLVSHRWVSQHYSGTHDDPHAYIESHGKVWADVVQDVTNYYNQFEEESKMLEQLQAQIQQLQQEVAQLKEYQAMSQIPQWATEAVNSAVAQHLMDSPEGRSYDLYAIMTILHRKGLI